MEQLITIRTLEELRQLKEYLQDKQYVAFDSETTGTEKGSEIIGFSISAEVDIGYYVVLSYWSPADDQLVYLETKDCKDFLTFLATKDLIMHNAVFDCFMVETNFGVALMPSVHTDTMILGHLLDENRSNGLKELGVSLFGEDARKEQLEMKESVHKNGGTLTKDKYELYKADVNLMAKYGAKDAILTLKLFYAFIPQLYEQGLDKFFYEDESMPLLRGPTYDLNTSGLSVDPEKMQILKGTLEAECLEAKAFILKEIWPHVKEKYPGTGKTNHFNIGSSKQLSWLMFFQLGNEFNTLTEEGRALCKALNLKLPYHFAAKRQFIETVTTYKGRVWEEARFNPKTNKMSRPKTIGDAWNYIGCGKETLEKFSDKYQWCKKLLEYNKNMKLLSTYVTGIQNRIKYNTIRPSFLQHGTTSGRYSSKNPNFQNLPREDKRVKACIVAGKGNTFVGADYSQLEPRVFASFSGDERLLKCFKEGQDFYSVIGVEIFDRYGASLFKDDENSFAKLYPSDRDITKRVALSTTYGTTAAKMAILLKKPINESQEVIDNFLERFPSVHEMMTESHEMAMRQGYVTNLFGRPRRMPQALHFKKLYGNSKHSELPYEARNVLNLAVNHRIQSTGASIMNRAAISCWKMIKELEKENPLWKQVKIVLQVHDELILRGPESLGEEMALVLKTAMEQTVTLPGVDLIADPKIGYSLADLK